jgi:RNA polymerase sigma factor (sigma-70 family)
MNSVFDSLPDIKLTSAEESALARDIQTFQREDDINALVMANMREAVIYTRKTSNGFLADDELVSICYTALVKNARRFKPDWQRFFAFSKAGLRGDVTSHIRDLDAVKKSKMISRECLSDEYLAQRTPRDTEDDVCVEALTREVEQPDFDGMVTRERFAKIAPVVRECCTEHEQMMLNLIYLNGYNFREAAELLAVSRAAMQTLHAKALKKIRCALLSKNQLFE